MKKILLFLFFVSVAFVVNAQVLRPSGLPTTNSPSRYDVTGYQRDSAFLYILRDSFPAKYPSVIYHPNGNLYKTEGGTGAYWTLITDTTWLSNRIDLKLSIADTAAMLSYYAYKDLTNTHFYDSTTALRASINTKQNQFIFNTKDYGAYGDNVHDDQPAIQAAIDAAVPVSGVVLIQGSTGLYFKLNDSLTISNGVRLVGLGSQTTVLMPNHNRAYSINVINSGSQLENFYLDCNGSFSGHGGSSGGILIKSSVSSNTSFQRLFNVNVSSRAEGFTIDGTANQISTIWATNCDFFKDSVAGYGVSARNIRHLFLTNCNFFGIAGNNNIYTDSLANNIHFNSGIITGFAEIHSNRTYFSGIYGNILYSYSTSLTVDGGEMPTVELETVSTNNRINTYVSNSFTDLGTSNSLATQSQYELTNRRIPFVNSSGQLKDTTGFYLDGSTLTAASFSGAGTGLTGTASGLSIGGNAATATALSNSVTFNNSGSGDASGTTFNGSATRTISYNSVGASPLAGSSSLVTTGALTSGSIASGFGSINIGANSLSAGAISGNTGTFSGTITQSSESANIVLNRTGGTTYGAGVAFQTGGVNNWILGTGQTTTGTNFQLYNYGTGTGAFSIDYTNNAATFASSVTASSFVKSDGTSSQLLAADGSVVTAGTNITISGGSISTNNITPTTSTPSSFNLSNLSNATPAQFIWTRVGSNVIFSGQVSVVVTSTGATSFEVDMPYASNFTLSDDASGSGSIYSDAKPAQVTAQSTNDRLYISWTATTTGSQQVIVTGQYVIK